MVDRKPKGERRVVVAGDRLIHWNICPGSMDEDGSLKPGGPMISRYPGGAWLLADLVADVAGRMAAATAPLRVEKPAAPPGPADLSSPGIHQLWATWRAGTAAAGQPVPWRVSGLMGVRLPAAARGRRTRPPGARNSGTPELVVLHDSDLGFRDQPDEWPGLPNQARALPWIILQVEGSTPGGSLWKKLVERSTEKLIVVLDAGSLREAGARITRDLSWEQTAQDIAWELCHNRRLSDVQCAAHVVVALGPTGAFHFSRSTAAGQTTGARRRLIFQPATSCREWAESHPGLVFGELACLTAGLARAVLSGPGQPDIESGITAGLRAMDELHTLGWTADPVRGGDPNLVFPVKAVVAQLSAGPRPLAAADVPPPIPGHVRAAAGSPGDDWSIVRDRVQHSSESLAESIVTDGPAAAIRDFPVGRFNKLLAVDRREIESLRAVRSLIAEYRNRPAIRNPLCIAVFGAPGSGKSFAVKQVAQSVGRDFEQIEFNVSQFRGPEDLVDAFHRVRDAGLRGAMPLVFWDEFDTAFEGRPLGWLSRFIGPMQDGRFLRGEVEHPLGRAIFVFAGGTADRMSRFGHDLDPKELRAVKGPDFVSRLKGFIDILGPNPADGCDVSSDPYCRIRRAILLRSLIESNASQLLKATGSGPARVDIDPGVLKALLRIDQYRHGARSMESILASSQLADRGRLDLSCLPPENLLDLHVDARRFMALAQPLELDPGTLELLARANHEEYQEHMRSAGGARRGKPFVRVPYDNLPDEAKEQNREAVRDYPARLASCGYMLIAARRGERPAEFTRAEVERLAEAEHERWTRSKLDKGWFYSPRDRRDRLEHRALLRWRPMSQAESLRRHGPRAGKLGRGILPQSEKETDRAQIRRMADVLARAGFTFVSIRGHSPA